MDIVREKMKEFVIKQGHTLAEGEDIHKKPIIKIETATSGFGLSTKDKFNSAEETHKNQKELFNQAIGVTTPSSTSVSDSPT